MPDDILQEQLDYYRARAEEYDTSLRSIIDPPAAQDRPENREWMQAVRAIHALGHCGRVLELAGGTGLWTKELAQITTDLTVLDGAPEMLAINRAKVGDRRVRYDCVDLFRWEPEGEVDLVFFAFWLSHVPPDLVDPFLDKLQRAVAPGGRVFIVDEPSSGHRVSGPAERGMYQQRAVKDGRVFRIVKVYPDPHDIQRRLQQRGFAPGELRVGKYFFHLVSTRQTER